MKRGILLVNLIIIVFVLTFIPLIYAQEESEKEKSESFFDKIKNFFKNFFKQTNLDENIDIQKSIEEEIVNEEILDICNRNFSPKYSDDLFYDGALFDAHFHMPLLIDFSGVGGHIGEQASDSNIDPVLDKDILLNDMLCLLEKEKSRGMIGFTILVDEVLQKIINKAESINSETGGKINLFLMSMDFNSEKLNSIQQTNPGVFKGYGEVAFYLPNLKTQNPDNPNFMKVYEIAGENNLIVMIHPDARQETQIENAIRANPNTKFLLHGPEIENTVTGIISKYPNVYYSIDAILIRAPGSPGGLIYTTNNLQEMKSSFDQNYDRMMSDAVSKWKSRIEQYPDRFMWGTDRAYKWHHDEEVSILLEEFARDFIGKLDSSVQEKFAYQNAENILK